MERIDRFRVKYQLDEDGHWIWRGAKGGSPNFRYGVFYDGSRLVGAHRWSYEYFVGPIPDGLTIDHLCRVTLCVNPNHLEAVTLRVNLLRANTFQARNAAKTRCPLNHPYDDKNTRFDKRGNGHVRVCRACIAMQDKTRRAALPKKGRPVGERGGTARLTWEKARAIRALHAAGDRSMASIAREFGVAPPTVRSIVLNRAWIETEDPPA